ncbi:sulfite exporter TauE/SafE family protein [Rothia nasimurium]|uniref:Probable membrane transporter protein n=1 Tax=Rothia nasimurium TaxID=85336 RepID=A0A4Y9F3J8_9MICC|nr:sulfite exporter TauE/SafE family protein [Rothia nasimurium]MBF0808608.1 sulfite exporter TauE/SafE family protein [Rothia nasimurium]TFU21712.1 sulfite exporter TauE/SafE family protein [Rothia nasimurium]
MLPELSTVAWSCLGVGAFLVGISKTAIPGFNTVSVALFASILPAKISTGALLILLMVGDIFAILVYRKHAHWLTLIRMVPAVLLGLIVGALFLHFASDTGVKRGIGALLLMLMGATLWQRYHAVKPIATEEESSINRVIATTFFGGLGGFTTMVANSGGPVMSMYFLTARFPVQTFLGTAAWFFAVMNLAKLPFSIGLGIVNVSTLTLDAVLVPAVLAGAWCGWRFAAYMSQQFFDRAVIAMTTLGALWLMVG